MSKTNGFAFAACLIGLGASSVFAADQTPVPQATAPAPAQPATPFSGQPLAPFAPKIAPLPQPDPAVQPAGTIPAPASPAPILIYGSSGTSTAPARSPALGSELHNNIREDEQRYREKSAEARQAFERRQADARKVSAASMADKGFWERRRLTSQFRDSQAQDLKEFDAEQERKRRLYEWRYP